MYPRRWRRSYYTFALCLFMIWLIPLLLLYIEEFEVTVVIGKRDKEDVQFMKTDHDGSNKSPLNSIDSNNRYNQKDPKAKRMVNPIIDESLRIDLASELDKIKSAIIANKDNNNKDDNTRAVGNGEGNELRLANYERVVGIRTAKSPGELGRGYKVTSKVDKEREKKGYDKHAFNEVVSDKISIYRRLKDYRNDK